MYDPQINDYVKWRNIEGWVYFKCDDYITIEISARPKPYCDLASKKEIHKKIHCCVLCFTQNFSELSYVKSRKSVYDESITATYKSQQYRPIDP